MINLTPNNVVTIPAREKIQIPLLEHPMGAVLGGIQLGGDDSTVNERRLSTIADAINVDGNYINDLINDRLDTDAKNILDEFTFGASGAIQIGTYVNGVSGDIRLSPNGIVSRNKTGANTIAIDGTTGDITIVGTVTATAGNIGGWDISSVALYKDGATDAVSAGMAPADYPFYAGAKYANRASAPFRVTPAGDLYASSATISGAVTITGGSGIANLTDAGALAVLDVIGDAHITGTITVSHTEAKCTNALADQTSANTAANISGQGALATQNTADFATDVSGTEKPANNADVTLSAINGGLTVTGGGITLDAGGSIKGGQTAYNTGTGFFLGYDTDAYKFSVGNSSTDYFNFDGSNISLSSNNPNAIIIDYGSDILLKHGGDIKFTSVTAPTACTGALAGAGAGNVDNGTHYYKITFVNEAGETELGTNSNSVTVSDNTTDGQVSLTDIPVSTSGSVTARKIYRTKAGDSNYYLVDTISDNTTTTYTDNIADSSLSGNRANYKQNDSFGKVVVDNIFSLSLGNVNTFVGQKAGENNVTGFGLVAVGNYSLNSNTTGVSNTAVGSLSLQTNTTGDDNTAIGYYTLNSNTTGCRNTAIGYYSLNSNTEGYNNIAIGDFSLPNNTTGDDNIAIGRSSLYYNEGDDNIAVGNYSLLNTSTGYGNTAIGYNAGKSITTGFSNVFIGTYAGFLNQKVDAENSIAIGYNAYTTASNQVHIGNTAISWIGGQVSWSTYSDKRVKKNIKDYTHGLDLITKLRPVEFDMKDDKTAKRHSGFIAQEVEKIGIPFYGINKPVSEKDFYSLQYAEFVVPLVNSIQEQQKQIENLQQRLNNLRK